MHHLRASHGSVGDSTGIATTIENLSMADDENCSRNGSNLFCQNLILIVVTKLR